MTAGLLEIRDSLAAYLDLPCDQARLPDLFHYYSPEVYELELEYIWRRQWLVVGHTCWLQKRGDYFAWEILGEPIAVVRGEDGNIRALSSVCRHRSMPITEDGTRGNLKHLLCPYHLWSYGLDGKLKGAPHMESNKAFDANQIALPEFRLEVWNGIVFINFDDNAAPLGPQLEGIAAAFRFCDRDGLESPNVYDTVWEANWKQAMENGENYHGPGTHPEAFTGYAPLSQNTVTSTGESWATMTLPLISSEQAAGQAFEPDRQEIGMVGRKSPGFELCLTPPANFLMLLPGSLALQMNWPISIDNTRVIMMSVLDGKLTRKLTPEEAVDPNGPNQVFFQDDAAFERGIGRAVRSRKSSPGLLSLDSEGTIIAMHQWRARRLLAAIDTTQGNANT